MLVARRFAALGDPLRVRVLRALIGHFPSSTRDVDLVKELGTTPAALDEALGILTDVDLLEPFGTLSTHHRASLEAVREMTDFLWEDSDDRVFVR